MKKSTLFGFVVGLCIVSASLWSEVTAQPWGEGSLIPCTYEEVSSNESSLQIWIESIFPTRAEKSSYQILFTNEIELFEGVERIRERVLSLLNSHEPYLLYGHLSGGEIAKTAIPYLEKTWHFWEELFLSGYAGLWDSEVWNRPLLQGWDRGSASDAGPKTEEARPFFDLPLTNEDKKNIRDLISCMADKNLWQLLMEKKLMEKKADKIRKIHPMRFAGFAVTDPHLKRCMKAIESDPLKWAYFIDGYAEKMREEARAGRLLMYVPGFAECVSVEAQVVYSFLENKDYEGFIKNFL